MKKEILSLPFYGKVGSISKIECVYQEEGMIDHYLKYEYDVHGTEKIPQIIPKRQFNRLEESYYHDVKEYLSTNNSNYYTSKKINAKSKKQKQKLYFDTIFSLSLSLISFILSCLSVNAIGATWITALSLITFAAPGAYAIIKINEIVEDKTAKKKAISVNCYQKYQTSLNEFNIKKDKEKKATPTKYYGIGKERQLETTIQKARTLKK